MLMMWCEWYMKTGVIVYKYKMQMLCAGSIRLVCALSIYLHSLQIKFIDIILILSTFLRHRTSVSVFWGGNYRTGQKTAWGSFHSRENFYGLFCFAANAMYIIIWGQLTYTPAPRLRPITLLYSISCYVFVMQSNGRWNPVAHSMHASCYVCVFELKAKIQMPNLMYFWSMNQKLLTFRVHLRSKE